MVVSKRVARFNRVATNRVVRPIAGHTPGLAIVRHRGRRSGQVYRTPVTAYARGDGYVIALVYGVDADWVRNVTAAGGCELQVRGRRLRLASPRVVHDGARRDVPTVVRPALRLLGVDDFLYFTVSPSGPDDRGTPTTP
jgi:deazaflavin-dependent oxidoreductase (nitroreductase family)